MLIRFVLVIFILSKSFMAFSQENKITFYGHACFMLEFNKDTKLLIDPVKLADHSIPNNLKPDVVTISHLHRDHTNTSVLKNEPIILYGLIRNDDGEEHFNKIDTIINGVHIYNVLSDHRDPAVTKMLNTIFVYEYKGYRIAHLGDLAITLNNQQIEEIGEIDVLMVPVGGKYALVPEQAKEVIKQLKVKQYVFPMHYKCEIADFLPYSIDDFLEEIDNVETLKGNKIKVDLSDPPDSVKYIKMGYK